MEIMTKDGKTAWPNVALIAVASMLCSGQALAQNTPPASCVTALSKEYGATPALRMECTNATDCTFQAPTGNASALALIGAMVKTVEACFTSAGLAVVKEDVMPQGTTRQYGQAGAAQMCAVLISTTVGEVADGLRATCQPVKAQ